MIEPGLSSKIRILVVEDETIVSLDLQNSLRMLGYEVVASATSGPEAIAKASAVKPDLVLMDVILHGEMDGVQAAKAIHSKLDIPVIFLTACADEKTLQRAKVTGPFGYMIKPFEDRELHSHIEIAMYRHRMEWRLRESEERYYLATQGANDGIWDWDVQRKAIYFSPRWKSMLGYSENQIGNSPMEWFNRIHPSDKDQVQKKLTEHLLGLSSHFECEYRILSANGAYRWVLCRGLARRDDKGEAYRVAGSQTDITDRKVYHPLTGLPNQMLLNGNGRYLGAVAIADLRRLLISGALGEEEIGSYPPRHSYSLTEDSLKSRKEANNIISDMQLYSLRFIPILGNGGKIQDVLSIEDLMRLHGFSGVEGGLSESSRRVLVVGGAGFLGSVLTQKLLGRGFKVSLDPLTGDENLEIVEGDLRNIHTCVSSLADVDAVVLLAAIVGDPASKVRPTETIETNVLAAQALASACKLHHINRFLYASTCSVYGIGADLLDEEAPLNPVSLYARTKIESEKIILGMGDEYFSPTILRMGTLYGYSPRMRFDLVVNTWIGRQILQALDSIQP